MNILSTNRKGRHPVKIKWCEVVRVASLGFLVNARHQACRYETESGLPLEPGYYLALWPDGASQAHYGTAVRYLGPLPSREAAYMMQVTAHDLGIIVTDEREGVLDPANLQATASHLQTRTPYPPISIGLLCAHPAT